MFHLRLIKGLSYDGAVRASVGAPDVFTDDPKKYKAALESGYSRPFRTHRRPPTRAREESPKT